MKGVHTKAQASLRQTEAKLKHLEAEVEYMQRELADRRRADAELARVKAPLTLSEMFRVLDRHVATAQDLNVIWGDDAATG